MTHDSWVFFFNSLMWFFLTSLFQRSLSLSPALSLSLNSIIFSFNFSATRDLTSSSFSLPFLLCVIFFIKKLTLNALLQPRPHRLEAVKRRQPRLVEAGISANPGDAAASVRNPWRGGRGGLEAAASNRVLKQWLLQGQFYVLTHFYLYLRVIMI